MKTMAEILEELDKHRPDHREYEGGWWELACAGCDFAKGQRLSHLDWAPYRIHRAEVFAAALSAAGFGPVREAQAQALRDAAEIIREQRPEIGLHINVSEYRMGKNDALTIAAANIDARATAITKSTTK